MRSVRRDILQAMKTPSRFQSVRKVNSTFDLKGSLVCSLGMVGVDGSLLRDYFQSPW